MMNEHELITLAINIVGIAGATLALLAFFMNQTDRWDHRELKYDVTNLLAATFLCINAVYIGSVAFFILNLVWGSVALRDIVERKYKTKPDTSS